MVKADLDEHRERGIKKYGAPLTDDMPPHNNMNPLRNAYEEALDLAMYLRKEIEDRGL